MSLKLKKLPDRDPAKIIFAESPDLNSVLNGYAELYWRAYHQKKTIADLIPFMLDAFMNADPGVKRSREQHQDARAIPTPNYRMVTQKKENQP